MILGLKQKNAKVAYAALSFAILAVGIVSLANTRASYADSSPYEQYILQQQPALSNLVAKALSPTGNVSVPSDLSDIMSLGQQLASKEFTASTNALNNNESMLATRYASSGDDLYRHLLNLMMQYELDNKYKQARTTGQVSELTGIISNIQWKEVRIYEITKSATKFNQTMPPEMSNVTTLIANAKQDVQNVFAAESSNSTDFKAIEKYENDANKNLTKAENILRHIWSELEKNIDKIQGQTKIDKMITKLTDMANVLQQKAQNQSNSDALAEISTAMTDLQQAQNSVNSGDFKSAIHFVREASIHLSAAQSLLG